MQKRQLASPAVSSLRDCSHCIIGVTGVKENGLTKYMRVTTRARVRVVSVNRKVQIQEV